MIRTSTLTILTLLTSAAVSHAQYAGAGFGSYGGAGYPVTTAGYGSYGQPVTSMASPPISPYRNTWGRVSVTRYQQPTMTTNPVSGVPQVTLRPCTTNEWQVRRVPDTLGRITSFFAPQPVYAQQWAAAPMVVACEPAAGAAASKEPYYPPSQVAPNPVQPGGQADDGRPSLDPNDVAPQGEASRTRGGVQAQLTSNPLNKPTLQAPPRPTRPPSDVVPIRDRAREQPSDADWDYTDPVEAVPPLLSPNDITRKPARDRVVPASLLKPLPPAQPVRSLPTDKAWDDRGWRSAR